MPAILTGAMWRQGLPQRVLRHAGGGAGHCVFLRQRNFASGEAGQCRSAGHFVCLAVQQGFNAVVPRADATGVVPLPQFFLFLFWLCFWRDVRWSALVSMRGALRVQAARAWAFWRFAFWCATGGTLPRCLWQAGHCARSVRSALYACVLPGVRCARVRLSCAAFCVCWN